MYFSKLNIKYLDTFFKFTALKSNQKTKKQKTKVLKNIPRHIISDTFFPNSNAPLNHYHN